jgi:hypothetical protein
MGTPANEANRQADEGPQTTVTISHESPSSPNQNSKFKIQNSIPPFVSHYLQLSTPIYIYLHLKPVPPSRRRSRFRNKEKSFPKSGIHHPITPSLQHSITPT